MEVSFHITDSCNLNCKSCLHMVPLSAGYHYFIDTYIEPQLKLLAKRKNIINILNIMGGEPTLHPDIIKILYIARENLPETKIRISTNGTNLNIFNDTNFITAILENKIEVAVTQYPYSQYAEKNYEILYSILNTNKIPYISGKITKFLTQPFVKSLNNDINVYKWCKSFHYCTMVKDFKLYVCHLAAYVNLLKEKFPDLDWIEIDDNSYVDLTDENLTDEQILTKLSSLSIICKHCAELNRWWSSDVPGDMIDWAKSELLKEEWIKE